MLSDVKVFAILNADDTIGRIIVNCPGETEEFAKPCTEADFLSQFIGKKGPFYDVDVVTGATHTSNAVVEALNKYYELSLPTEEPATAEFVSYYWADYQITLENWNLAPAILNQPLINCVGFSYKLYLNNIQSGSPYGEWTLYGETGDGAWVALASFYASSDSTTIDITLPAAMDLHALCAVRKEHTECTHSYAYTIANPRYGTATADGCYHYQLFRYYCAAHDQETARISGNMVVLMRRSNGDNQEDPAVVNARNFLVSDYTQHCFHEAVGALLPTLNGGACQWDRKWVYLITTSPLPEEKSDSENYEFGSEFTYQGVQWQGKCIKTPSQATPTAYVNQATYDSRWDQALAKWGAHNEDALRAYAKLLSEQPLLMWAPYETPATHYALYDIDNDGTVELIVFGWDAQYNNAGFETYTYRYGNLMCTSTAARGHEYDTFVLHNGDVRFSVPSDRNSATEILMQDGVIVGGIEIGSAYDFLKFVCFD